MDMARYLIEHSIPHADKLTAVELKAITQQSLRAQQNMEAEIQWINTTITADRMLCLYIADSEEIIREHARLSGLPVSRVCEVTAVINPMSDVVN